MRYDFIVIVIDILIIVLIFNATDVSDFLLDSDKVCILWFSCDDNNRDDIDDTLIINESFIHLEWWSVVNFSEYNYTQEGIVVNKYPYDESFFETLDKVIKVSENEYNNIIKEISHEGDFEYIYNKYSCIFNNNYSIDIDNGMGGDYIQNIGELISNNYHGDCDDYATWLYLIAKEQGLIVRYIIGYSFYGGHAWIQIKVNDEWIDYDSTWNNVGIDIVSWEYPERYYYGGEDDE